MKILYKITLLTGLVLLLPLSSYSQNAPPPAAPPPAAAAPPPAAAPPAAQAPAVVQPPPDFPDYIVTPREDLNNFDLSTMSESDDIDYRDGVGTLGTTERRENNLEVNAQLKKRKMDRENARKEAEEKKNQEIERQTQAQSTPPSLKSSTAGSITPGVRGGLFMWKDENGILHATNNLGQVPMEYQMQAIQNSGGTLDINNGDDN